MEQSPIPSPTRLTPMERELLGYVEQLVSVLSRSEQVLSALETQSSARHEAQLNTLSACVSALLEQQLIFANCLNDLVSGSLTLATLTARSDASLKQLKAAEQRLKSANAS